MLYKLQLFCGTNGGAGCGIRTRAAPKDHRLSRPAPCQTRATPPAEIVSVDENLKKFLFTQKSLPNGSEGREEDNKIKKQIKPNNPPQEGRSSSLVRTSPLRGEGRRFKSCPAHHLFLLNLYMEPINLLLEGSL